MRFIRTASLTIFVFGLLGWAYIALNAEVHPDTLSLPLTHLLPYPREDTFGVMSFLASFVGFFIWRYVTDDKG
jgi:hypothetical protein